MRPIRETPARNKVLYGGRGSGKSWGVARILLEFASKAVLRVLCTREVQNSIDESVHQLLRDQAREIGLEHFYDFTKKKVTGQNGSEFIFAGLQQQHVAKVKSTERIDIVWVEEGQFITQKSWDILIPTVREDDSEIWVTFNPELDTDETYQRFVLHPQDSSIVIKMNWRDNPWFPEVLEQERLAMKRRDPEAYDNVWEGNCRAAVEGAIYAKEVAQAFETKRVRPLPHDPLLKTHCIWDLGWNDQMTIIMAQRAANSIMVIDYLEDSHRTYDSYVAELNEKPYQWGRDFLPHDGKHKDPKTGKSHNEILEALGRKVSTTPDMGLEAGIKLARQTFPRVFFDEDKAAPLLEHLRRYKRQVNQNTDEPGPPVHDVHSHGSDAFRYMAVVADEMINDGDIVDPYEGLRRGWAG